MADKNLPIVKKIGGRKDDIVLRKKNSIFLFSVVLAVSPIVKASANLKLFFSNLERASLFHSSDPYPVTGHVNDSTTNTQLTINGQDIPLDPDGNFIYTLLPQQGENLVAATVRDLKGSTFSSRSIYQSDTWLGFNATNNSTDVLEDTITLFVDSSFFQDIVSSFKERFGLKHAIQSLFSSVNMTTFADEPIFDTIAHFARGTSQYHVKGYLRSINLLNPNADAALTKNGLYINGSFSSQSGIPGFTALLYVEISLKLFNQIPLPIGNFYINYSADEIDFTTNIYVNKSHDLPLNASMQNLTFKENSEVFSAKILTSEINSFFQPWQWFFPVSFNEWISWIATHLLQSNGQKIISKCSEKLNEKTISLATKAFEQILPFCSFDVSFSTNSVSWASYHPEIKMHAELDNLTIDQSTITASFNTSIQSDQNTNHSPKLVYLRNNCDSHQNVSDLPYLNFQAPIHASVRIDYINQIFHTLWWGGLFDITHQFDEINIPQYSDSPLKNISLTIHPLLPPIVNDCQEKNFHLQAGDIEVFLSFQILEQNITIQGFTSAFATAQFQGNGDDVSMFIDSPVFTSFDVVKTQGLSSINPNLINTLFEDYLLPLFEKNHASNHVFSFTIPPIPLNQIFHWLTKENDIYFHNVTLHYEPGQLHVHADAH